MPNVRGKFQTAVAFTMDKRLLKALDQARLDLHENRSLFVRKAVAQWLREKHKLNVPEDWIFAVDRVKQEE